MKQKRDMTNNDYLKQEYEAHPERWIAEYQNPYTKGWYRVAGDPAFEDFIYRLRPIVPEGMDIPDGAYAYGHDKPGAVSVRGPITRPANVTSFSGWLSWSAGWRYPQYYEGTVPVPYLIDLSNPNAEAILALNRPGTEEAAKLAAEDREYAESQSPQPVANDYITATQGE